MQSCYCHFDSRKFLKRFRVSASAMSEDNIDSSEYLDELSGSDSTPGPESCNDLLLDTPLAIPTARSHHRQTVNQAVASLGDNCIGDFKGQQCVDAKFQRVGKLSVAKRALT